MAYRRPRRGYGYGYGHGYGYGCRYGIPVLVTLLLAGCSSGGAGEGVDAKRAGRGASPTAEHVGPDATPAPGDTGYVDADPARLPRTKAAADALIDQVIADPGSFGPGVVKRTPYESDPATWPALSSDCVWYQDPPGDHVLATRTRSFEVPATKNKGPLRLSAVVTVHRTRKDAVWEMAESVEETMRCPTQQLDDGEFIGSMVSAALAQGEGGQNHAEDALTEYGEYRSSEVGGPHAYTWQQAQTLQFTVAVTGKGAEGRTEDEVNLLTAQAHAAMLVRLESAIEKQS